MAGYDELAIAGDAARGLPASGGNQTVQDQRLERGAGGGQGARCFAEPVRCQQAASGEIEHQNPGIRSGARGLVHRSLPTGRQA